MTLNTHIRVMYLEMLYLRAVSVVTRYIHMTGYVLT